MGEHDKGNEALTLRVVRRACELLFSLNLSFAIVSITDLDAHAVLAPFFSLEFWINGILHIRQTDLVRGYIALAASSITLALCLWLVLRFSTNSVITKALLRFGAGPVMLCVPAVFWIYMFQRLGWPFGWPYRWAPFELALALVCAWLYINRSWRFPAWFSVLLLAAHYVYWFWIPGASYFTSNYSGPIAPVLGFCSVLTWALYVRCLPGPNLAHS